MPFRHWLRCARRDIDADERKVARLPVGNIDRREKTMCCVHG
jgi:hypothetical protein